MLIMAVKTRVLVHVNDVYDDNDVRTDNKQPRGSPKVKPMVQQYEDKVIGIPEEKGYRTNRSKTPHHASFINYTLYPNENVPLHVIKTHADVIKPITYKSVILYL